MDSNKKFSFSVNAISREKPSTSQQQANAVPSMLSQDSDTIVSKQPLPVGQGPGTEKLKDVPELLAEALQRRRQKIALVRGPFLIEKTNEKKQFPIKDLAINPTTTSATTRGKYGNDMVAENIKKAFKLRKENLNLQARRNVTSELKQVSNESTVQKNIGQGPGTEKLKDVSELLDEALERGPILIEKTIENKQFPTKDLAINPTTTSATTQGKYGNDVAENIKKAFKLRNENLQACCNVTSEPKQVSNESTVQKNIGPNRKTEENSINRVGSPSVSTTPQLTKKIIKENDNGERVESIINVGNAPSTKLKQKLARKIQQQDSVNQQKKTIEHTLTVAAIDEQSTVSLLAGETNSKVSLKEKNQAENPLSNISRNHLAQNATSVNTITGNIDPTPIAYKCLLCEYLSDSSNNMARHIHNNHNNHYLKSESTTDKAFKYVVSHTVIAGNALVQAKKRNEEIKMQKSKKYKEDKEDKIKFPYSCDIHEVTFQDRTKYERRSTHGNTLDYITCGYRFIK